MNLADVVFKQLLVDDPDTVIQYIYKLQRHIDEQKTTIDDLNANIEVLAGWREHWDEQNTKLFEQDETIVGLKQELALGAELMQELSDEYNKCTEKCADIEREKNRWHDYYVAACELIDEMYFTVVGHHGPPKVSIIRDMTDTLANYSPNNWPFKEIPMAEKPDPREVDDDTTEQGSKDGINQEQINQDQEDWEETLNGSDDSGSKNVYR